MRSKIHIAAVTTVIAVLLYAIIFAPSARANVYATNVKLNGKQTNIVAFSGTGFTINYILNEPATRGVIVRILSGTNIIRSISVASGAGTLKGTNSVTWDGKDNNGRFPAGGTYKVSVTASATGFTTWTQTSGTTNQQMGYYVFSPRGMAVNTNQASLYYGRVFVGNAQNNLGGVNAGDHDGILKLNSDGSFADEGQSTGGYNWIDDGFNDSPHYLRYGDDDRIYALDYTGTGEIVAFDMLMTNYQKVLSVNNYANNHAYGGQGWGTMDVTDAGKANGRLWLGDVDDFGAGIWTWHMVNGVADPNDHTGANAVTTTGDVSDAPDGGFMADEKLNIFISQLRTSPADPVKRSMVFTNWNGAAILVSTSGWKVGGGDDTMRYVYDTVLDKRTNATYVALPMGIATPSGGFVGGIRVLYASNGVVVTNATGTQSLTNLDSPNSYFGAAWDAVGNLYGASSSLHQWRVFSPPGTNQATTVAVETFQALPLPTFTSINLTNAALTLRFTGLTTDTPGLFTLQSATNALGPYTNVTVAVISQTSPGVFKAATVTNGLKLFFRLKR